ncbi:MAG: hypothetical protein ACJ8F7_01350 [Gemmataceae bacterium]
MLFIHGEYNTEKHRGVVADHCGVCGEPTIHRITQHFRTPHLYFVALGSGNLTATLLTCTGCGLKTPCPDRRYAQTLGEVEAQSMHVGKVLLQTNPRLAEAIAYRAELRDQAHDLERAEEGQFDPRVALALSKMAALDCSNPRTIELQARIGRWAILDDAGQTRLLRDIDSLTAEIDARQSSALFVNLMVQRLKPGTDGFLEFLAFVVTLVGGGILTGMFLWPSNIGLMVGIVASLAAAVAAAVWTQRQVQRWKFGRFFRRVLLPEAATRDIDRAGIIEVLTGIDVNDKAIDARLRGMAKALPLLKELAGQQHPDFNPVEAG